MFQHPEINLFSNDVVRLEKFYLRLGFRETYRTPKRGEPVHVEVTLENFTMGVSSVAAAIADHGFTPNLNGRPFEIILWTEDPDRDYALLTAEGAPTVSPPHTFHANQYEFRTARIADPDGNIINLANTVSR